MNKKIPLLYFLIGLLFVSYTSSAQQNLTLYNMDVVPQRMYANPAFFPSYSKVNIGLPVLSSVYLNASNSGFKYSDLIQRNAKDSLSVNYPNMLSKLGTNNYLSTSLQIDLLSFGFAVKKNYFSFNATEKAEFRFSYPKSFMQFAYEGNGGALLGQPISFGFGINATHYREYGVGWARKINDKLTIGAKFKYLYGMENVSTAQSNVSLTTDPNSFAMTGQSNIQVNTSGINSGSFNNLNIENYLFKKQNNGLGVDLGGVYKLNDKFSFSASVTDLGFINWQNASANTSYQSDNPNGQYTFNGLPLSQVVGNSSSSSSLSNIGDTLKKTFKIDTLHKTYRTTLTSKIYLGSNYHLTEKINFGVLFYGEIFDKVLHPGGALSYNQRLGRWFTYSLSYSILNRSYNNAGMGFALNLGVVQWYIVSDNVLGAIFPQNAQNINVRTGINLTFGRIKNDKDKDGVPDKKDLCPTRPGPASNKGCPETKLSLIDSLGIKLKTVVVTKDSSFSFKFDSLPSPEFAIFKLEGENIAGINVVKVVNGGVSRKAYRKDSLFRFFITKLYLIDTTSGKTLKTVIVGKDSSFTFDKLPADDELALFKLVGENTADIKEVKVVTGSVSKKAFRNNPKDSLFRFIIKPKTKLILLDTLGNTLKTVVMKKDSSFVFDYLPADELVILRLEGENTAGINEVKTVTGGVSKKAIRSSKDGLFRFVINKPVPPPPVEPGKEVAIKLTQQEAEVLKKAFSNLEFASAKDVIKEGSFASLDELAGLMTKKPTWHLKISGHTDNQGNPAVNLKLSQKRAEAVKKYLVNKGIAADRFKVEWFGSKKPIADNKTEAGRQKNRRVEMLIIE